MRRRLAIWVGLTCLATLMFASQSVAEQGLAEQGDGFAILRVTTNGLSSLEGKGIKAGIESETRYLGLDGARQSLDVADDCFDDPPCRVSAMEKNNLKWGLSVIVTRVGPVVQVSCVLLDQRGHITLKNEHLIEAVELEHDPVLLPAKFSEEMVKLVKSAAKAESVIQPPNATGESSIQPKKLEDERPAGPNMLVLGAGAVLGATGTLVVLTGTGYAAWQYSIASDPTSPGIAKEAAAQQFLVAVGGTGAGALVVFSGAVIAGLSFTALDAE